MAVQAPPNERTNRPKEQGSAEQTEKGVGGKRIVVIAGILAILVALSIPGYRWFEERRMGQFKSACVEATKAKQWERLQAIAEGWQNWDTSSNDALLYRAEANFQQGELDEAADLLGRVSDDYHGVLDALTFQGEIFYGDLHRPEDAEKSWQRILSINPKSIHAHQRLISYYAVSLQRKKMVEQIRRAFDLRAEPPEAYAYLLLTNALGFTEGMVHVRNWLTSTPGHETFEAAEAVYMASHPENTNVKNAYQDSHFKPGDQRAMDACLKKYPRNIEVLAFHIEKQMYFGKADEVVKLLGSAPPEAMEDSRFWRFRAWLLQKSKDNEQAKEALQTSLKIDPFSWRSRWELGEVLRALELPNEAESMQAVAMEGKSLQEQLYKTDGRALTWDLVHKMRTYLKNTDDKDALEALDHRIRSQGGDPASLEMESSRTD